MGYRLHYAKHYAPEWKGGYLNWRDGDFADLVREEFAENYWMNDAETEIELERIHIEEYLQKLLEKPGEINPHFDTHGDQDAVTNAELAEVFKEVLQSEDDTIHMEWF